MNAIIYKDMVFLSEKAELSDKDKSSVRATLKYFMDGGHSDQNARRRTQLFHNHEHCTSRTAAHKLAKQWSDTFTRCHPLITRRFAIDWREAGKRERGNRVLLSCWLDDIL